MTKVLRSEDPRYTEVVERGVRKYVRDQAVLSDEIMSLLDMHGALTCNRLSLMIGANNQLVEQVLDDLMNDGRVTRMKRLGSRGRPHYFWSVADGAACNRIRFNGATILTAFQRTAVDRS